MRLVSLASFSLLAMVLMGQTPPPAAAPKPVAAANPAATAAPKPAASKPAAASPVDAVCTCTERALSRWMSSRPRRGSSG